MVTTQLTIDTDNYNETNNFNEPPRYSDNMAK